jgi:hypothetical protein
LGKAIVVLGLVTSLIGGMTPRLIKADGSVNMIVNGRVEATFAVRQAKAKPNVNLGTTARPGATAKTKTKAAVKKGSNMTTIGSIKNGVGKAMSLPGE